MRVAAGISFFDSIKELPRCLGSPDDSHALCNNVDYLIGINGRYDGFDADHNYAEDGSEEFFKKYRNAYTARYHGYQANKRQCYLDIAGELKCDFLIVIDTDEYIHPQYKNWPQFYYNLCRASTKAKFDYRLFWMKIYFPKDWIKAHNLFKRNQFGNSVRIHKNPGNQRYCLHSHFQFCHKCITDEMLLTDQATKLIPYHRVIDGVRLATDSMLRSESMLRSRDKWAWNMIHEERRREYILKNKHLYGLPAPEITGCLEYDKQGKPLIPL